MPNRSFVSYWMNSSSSPAFPPLTEHVLVDVAVVGAGIVGMTAGFLLKQEGLTVAVVDRGPVSGGVTGYTTAKVTSSHNLIYAHIESTFGPEAACTYGASNEAAIDTIAGLVDEHSIACDWERADNFVYTEHASSLPDLEAEVEAARRAGLPASLTSETELPFPVAGAVRFTNQAQFHPRRYLAALAAQVEGDGSHVFEDTVVTGVDESHPCSVVTERGTISAGDVIVATHMPILDRGLFFTKVHPHRSYVVAGFVDDDIVPRDMYISTGGATRSVRSTPADGRRLLLIGGEGHKTGTDPDTGAHYERLERWAREHYGMVDVAFRWSSQDNVSVDRLPYIGRLTRSSDHVFTATGFGKWGMTNGTVAAMILRDHIVGRINPWASLYDSKRLKPVASAKRFVTENAGVAAHFVGDRVLHHGAPRCTHLGCVLRENRAEGSWDCPCHGSRFDADGHVIHGPAVRDLKK